MRWTDGALLACAVLLLAGCPDGGTDPLTVDVQDGSQGHYGGPCNPDGSCGAGLECQHHVCVDAGD